MGVDVLRARTWRRQPGQHARIVSRFSGFIEGSPDEPVYLTEYRALFGESPSETLRRKLAA